MDGGILRGGPDVSEVIAIIATGDTYEEALGAAMAQCMKYLETDAQILREKPHFLSATCVKRNWYLQSSQCEPSAGGGHIGGCFWFERIDTE